MYECNRSNALGWRGHLKNTLGYFGGYFVGQSPKFFQMASGGYRMISEGHLHSYLDLSETTSIYSSLPMFVSPNPEGCWSRYPISIRLADIPCAILKQHRPVKGVLEPADLRLGYLSFSEHYGNYCKTLYLWFTIPALAPRGRR